MRLRLAPEQVTWLEQRCDEVNAGLELLPARSCCPAGRPPAPGCTSAAPSAVAPSATSSRLATPSASPGALRYLNRFSAICCSSLRAMPTAGRTRCGSPAGIASSSARGPASRGSASRRSTRRRRASRSRPRPPRAACGPPRSASASCGRVSTTSASSATPATTTAACGASAARRDTRSTGCLARPTALRRRRAPPTTTKRPRRRDQVSAEHVGREVVAGRHQRVADRHGERRAERGDVAAAGGRARREAGRGPPTSPPSSVHWAIRCVGTGNHPSKQPGELRLGQHVLQRLGGEVRAEQDRRYRQRHPRPPSHQRDDHDHRRPEDIPVRVAQRHEHVPRAPGPRRGWCSSMNPT